MKELDRVFEHWFASGAPADLDDEALNGLERLLDCQDTELMDWFLGRSEPPDKELRGVVAMLLANTEKHTLPDG